MPHEQPRHSWRGTRPSSAPRPPDWKVHRETIDLADVAVKLLGPPPGRKGSRGKDLWWTCPFHPDKNPSFHVEPGKGHWKCFGCGESGDAAELVMKLRNLTFPEAVAFLGGGPASPRSKSDPRPRPASRPKPKPPPGPKPKAEASDPDASQDRAMGLIDEAADRLWSAEGSKALEYLRRGRGLGDEAIVAAGLGWTPGFALKPDERGKFGGITIPWFGVDGLELVKIRQPDGREPRYAEVYRRRPSHYPGIPLSMLTPGWPLVVVEGELDCALLDSLIGREAAVITTGSASTKPTEAMTWELFRVGRIYLATDADAAGDRCASGWPERSIRVRPPEPHKDWTEAHLAGVDLCSFWGSVLGGR